MFTCRATRELFTMLNLIDPSPRRCDGLNRRSFLKAGTLGFGSVSLGLADLLRARAQRDDHGPARSGGSLGDPDLARRRPAPARDLRSQARTPPPSSAARSRR